MCGSAPATPVDNSAEVARIQAQEAAEARAAAEAKEAKERAQFESRLSSAYGTGLSSAQDYFSAQGLDPNEYINEITSAANSAKSRVTDLDASPGTYFENLGASVYDSQQDAQRARALRGFDTFAREGFATRRIGNDTDDPFLEAILEESRAEADDYARNLLDRGVITNSGYDAAIADLDGQRAGANSRLQDIGLSELERGRGQLRDIASTGRSAASSLNLGDIFDPYEYQGDIDQSQADFFANLGESLRGASPDDLFDTSGLAGIAGAASGAGNTAFNPAALSGLENEDEDTDEDDNDDDDDEDFIAF